MNRRAPWLCLALLLAAGRPVHARPWPLEDEPSAAASNDDVRAELALLGYRYDAASQGYVGPDGKALSPEGLKRYLAPFDYRVQKLSEDERTNLLLEGFRLEPATGHILSPGTHQPVTVLDYQSEKVDSDAAARRKALERLTSFIDGQDPAKPLSPGARAQAMTLLQDQELSANLVGDVKSLNLLAGTAAADFDKAYLDSSRAFDGKLGSLELAVRGKPLAAGAVPARPTAYFDADERALGASLQKATVDYLSRNPVGAELMNHFRDASGTVQLPAMVILPIDSQAAAEYDDGIVAIGQNDVVNAVVSQVPRSQRKKLKKQLADSRSLARYLDANPRAIDSFLKDNDNTLAHELTHAWQNRREPFWRESERGNFPDADYVEFEHEAFLLEMRYLHEKYKADPSALARQSPEDLQDYQRFVTDLDGWRDQITQTYLQSWPQDAYTLSTGEEIQKERLKTSQALEQEGPVLQALEKLKEIALGVGSSSEQSYQAGYSKLFDDFRRTQYPTLQKEAYGLLAKAYLKKADSAPSRLDLRYDLSKAHDFAQAAGDQAAADAAAARLQKELKKDSK